MPRKRVDENSYAQAFSFSLTDEDRAYFNAISEKVKKGKGLEEANKTDVMRHLLRAVARDWGLTNKDGSIKAAYIVKAKKARAKPKKGPGVRAKAKK